MRLFSFQPFSLSALSINSLHRPRHQLPHRRSSVCDPFLTFLPFPSPPFYRRLERQTSRLPSFPSFHPLIPSRGGHSRAVQSHPDAAQDRPHHETFSASRSRPRTPNQVQISRGRFPPVGHSRWIPPVVPPLSLVRASSRPVFIRCDFKRRRRIGQGQGRFDTS